MKIFLTHCKVNFVDKNNIFVGYDMSQYCDENVGYYISETEETTIKIESDEQDLDSYYFDTDYFEEAGEGDTGIVRFRLVNDGGPQKFLHLFNTHNGYYSHGWEVKMYGETTLEGSL